MQMTTLSRLYSALAVIAACTVFSLTGCGPSEAPALAQVAQTPEAPAQTAAPAPTPTPSPTPVPTPTPTPMPSEVKFAVVGDLMLHIDQVEDAYDAGTKTYDFNRSFAEIKPYLDGDLVIGNLETVFAGESVGYRDFPRFSAPDSFGEAIKNAGFNFLTTANNHSNDQGKAGVLRTLEILDELSIEHVGTYPDAESRDKIFIKEVNGIKFAFLSYSYGTNGLPLAEPFLVNLMDESLIRSDIAAAKLLEPDFIVVLPHMGNEYETAPKQVFKNWVQMMCEAGADIVLASHPHVLQPMEFIEVDGRSCFVVYSLGNFVSSQRTQPRDAGVVFNLYFTKPWGGQAELSKVGYIPTWVRFKNSEGKHDIQVLAVDAALEDGAAERLKLRAQDVTRLKAVQKAAEEMYPPELKEVLSGEAG